MNSVVNTSLKSKFKDQTVFILSVLVLFAIVGFFEFRVLSHTGGVFSYPMDDTFIHMAIAKNLAFFGNWGITKFGFQSASSSLLYTLILSGLYRLFSSSTLIPFIINIVAAVALLYVVLHWLKKQNVGSTARLIITILVVFLTPLPALVITGMEHTLQCLFSLLFIVSFSEWLEKMKSSETGKWILSWPVLVYGVVVSSIRYEGVFLVFIACVMLLYNKKLGLAIKLGIVALLPIIAFGIFSLSKGSYFFPNSVLLKSDGLQLSVGGIKKYMSSIFVDRLTTPPGIEGIATRQLLLILPITLLLFSRITALKPSHKYLLILITACTLMHLALASTGWFFRYEAYLILCTVVVLGVLCYHSRRWIFEQIKRNLILASLILFVLFFPFVARTLGSFAKTTRACINIYEQQYQMGQFFSRYYKNENIAANDVGAISFLTEGDNLDLWGLGDIEIAKSKIKKYYTPDYLSQVVNNRKIKYAVVYDKWFDSELLKRWQKVATWQITDNVICADDVVSFYSIEPGNVEDLRKSLQSYQPSLPPGIVVKYQ